MIFIKRILNLVFIFLVAEIAPFIAAYMTNIFSPVIAKIDPQGLFLWMAVHHVFQFLLGLVILKVYFRKSLKELGFNFNHFKTSIRIFKWFTVIWSLIIILFFITFSIFVKGFASYISHIYPPELKHIISTIAFDMLMLSAIGEEPIFRSFVGLGLQKYWGCKIKLFKLEISYAACLSAVIFMLSHINYDIFPFRFIHADPIKLTLNLFFGLFLAIVFEKTKSLFCTALAHTYSNLFIYVCGFITAYLLNG